VKFIQRLLLTAIIAMLLIGTFSIRAYAFANGQSATLVIGQKDFTSGTIATSQSGLYDPGGTSFDSSGNLWVPDWANNRILEFRTPFANGMVASLVIGQSDWHWHVT
jgi:hypothetical protein